MCSGAWKPGPEIAVGVISLCTGPGGCVGGAPYWTLLLCGPYWVCAAPKGHFLSPDSLAKGVFLAKIPWPRAYFSSEVLSQGGIFLTKTPKNWHFVANLAFVFGKFLFKREHLGWNSLKSHKNGLMIRKFSLAKGMGMFSTKISLAKGMRSKTGAAHPHQKFFGVPTGTGPLCEGNNPPVPGWWIPYTKSP